MPLNIGEIQTDIQVDSHESGTAAGAQAAPGWQQLAQLRALLGRLLDDGTRTAAAGNDD